MFGAKGALALNAMGVASAGAKGIGKLFSGGYGTTAAGAAWGGAAGGLWGAVSKDTSVLGGMTMGAGMGAAGARYGSTGMRSARIASGAGIAPRQAAGFGFSAMGRQAKSDLFKARNWGATQWSNRGANWNRVTSSLKNWRS